MTERLAQSKAAESGARQESLANIKFLYDYTTSPRGLYSVIVIELTAGLTSITSATKADSALNRNVLFAIEPLSSSDMTADRH